MNDLSWWRCRFNIPTDLSLYFYIHSTLYIWWRKSMKKNCVSNKNNIKMKLKVFNIVFICFLPTFSLSFEMIARREFLTQLLLYIYTCCCLFCCIISYILSYLTFYLYTYSSCFIFNVFSFYFCCCMLYKVRRSRRSIVLISKPVELLFFFFSFVIISLLYGRSLVFLLILSFFFLLLCNVFNSPSHSIPNNKL